MICLSVSADAGSKNQPSQEKNKHERIERPHRKGKPNQGHPPKKPRRPVKENN